jgi:hypothetical protein
MRPGPARTIAWSAVAGVLVLAMSTLASAPVVAKEGLAARLDAPIARDTPGGATILVRMSVSVLEGDIDHPVEGSPVYVKLVGRDGAESWELAREGPGGVYAAHIKVPATGIAGVEIGIHGSTDLPIRIVGQPLVAGPITVGTAQIAPDVPAASAPVARASAVVPPAVRPATSPIAAPATTPVTPILVLAGIAVMALVVGLAAIANHRARSAARLRVSGPSPEA